MFLAGTLNTLEIGLFLFVLFVLAGTVWLFLTSMDNLKELKEEQRRQYEYLHYIHQSPPEAPAVSIWKVWLDSIKRNFKKASASVKKPVTTKKLQLPEIDVSEKHSLSDIKSLLNQQQLALQKLQRQLDETVQREEVAASNKADQKVEELELLLEEKEAEIKQLLQQQKLSEKIMLRLEEVQKEFTFMQERVGMMERQAATAQQLSLELEDLRETHERLENDYIRKSEKLQEYMNENSRLHQQLCETEDKLQEANLQRQQLLKKVKLLEEMNNDLQTLSDTNKHLQTELRRIGELESMLNMMTEERDQLLRKRF